MNTHPKEATEANRATYWYPILEDTSLPVPDATLVELQHPFIRYERALEHPEHQPDDFRPPSLDYLVDAVKNHGTPCFIRSDLSSAKHHGINAIKANKPEDAKRCATRIIERHAMDFLGANPTHWMIRPWIEMDSRFRKEGYHGNPGLPIPPEYRVFATRDGEHMCTHWYWIRDEMKKRGPRDALQLVAGMKEETADDVNHLSTMGADAAEALGKVPAWSVDFALAQDGKWRLIDVADSRTSWHPETCANHEALMKPG